MTFGRIYTFPQNDRVHKVLIAAKYNGLTIEVPQFSMGIENKTPEYLAKFPMGKVPGFEDSNGNILSESGAMAYYGKYFGWGDDECL